jgi:hypothetical protein
MSAEVTFVGADVSASDKVLFLGPLEPTDGPFHVVEPGWTMAHIMHSAGAFPSVKQAKANGWDKPIPVGYDEFTVGKRKLRVFILTRFD